MFEWAFLFEFDAVDGSQTFQWSQRLRKLGGENWENSKWKFVRLNLIYSWFFCQNFQFANVALPLTWNSIIVDPSELNCVGFCGLSVAVQPLDWSSSAPIPKRIQIIRFARTVIIWIYSLIYNWATSQVAYRFCVSGGCRSVAVNSPSPARFPGNFSVFYYPSPFKVRDKKCNKTRFLREPPSRYGSRKGQDRFRKVRHGFLSQSNLECFLICIPTPVNY